MAPYPAAVPQLDRLQRVRCTRCASEPPMMKWAAREGALLGYCATLRKNSTATATEPPRPLTSLPLCLYRFIPKSEMEFLRD